MAAKLGRFQTLAFTGWKGLTKANLLASIYQSHPQLVSDFMVQLLALNRGKSLESELARYGTKYFEDDSDFTWQVVGSSRRNIVLIEARDENGNVVTDATSATNVGIGGVPFYLVFGEDWFDRGDIIFGNLNEVYPIRIIDEPRSEGTNTVYKVSCDAMASLDGIPTERLLAGEQFSRAYAPIERELSRRLGSVRHTAPVSMRNEWTHLRKDDKVPGSSMLNKKLACGLPIVDKAGKKLVYQMWMPYEMWLFELEWSDEKNAALMFGTTNRNKNGEYNTVGFSGEVIRMGSGLLEQMKYGNTIYYNKFSLKLLTDALYELSAAKLDMKDRVFVIRTGEMGALLFHNEVRNSLSGWSEYISPSISINADQLGMVRKTNSPLHQNSLAVGYQFTEFSAPNGVVVKLEVDNFYDDPVQNKILDNSGHPAMSSRFDIMDIGTPDLQNIFKCAIKNLPELRGLTIAA